MFQSAPTSPSLPSLPEKNMTERRVYHLRHRHYVNRGSFGLTLGSSSMFIIIFQLNDLPWSISRLQTSFGPSFPVLPRDGHPWHIRRQVWPRKVAGAQVASGKPWGFHKICSMFSCDSPQKWKLVTSYPIGSMYGIYANIGGILMVNVTIYGIHGSYGY